MPSNTNQTQADPAASWVRRTPRQQRQAAARFDREARQTIAAYKAREAVRNAQLSADKAIRTLERFGGVLLTNRIKVSTTGEYRALLDGERDVCRAAVHDAWRLLKANRSVTERLTVLA